MQSSTRCKACGPFIISWLWRWLMCLLILINVVAELWQPKRATKRSPITIYREKETHELIFSWLSWAAVLLVGAYARRWSRATWWPYTPNSRLIDLHVALCTLYFFNIGHPCYDQMTPVKTRYLPTSITWPYLNLQLMEVTCFPEVDRWPSAGFQLDHGLILS